ncbi:MAG: right-handed parallel beta-helix repeat-containing protein, partial [Thermoplasmata archaeon]|nr:right-handed parallel beta-helix repeat-containing protein [Thermoplasmata archaeon]
FSGDPYGLYAGLVLNSHAVQIGGDQFTHSSGQGLYVQSSSQLTITDSNLSYAAGTSLILESCSDATVRGNVLQHSGSDSMGL